MNGAVFFDECSTWLNARTWSDKDREGLISWLAHARKLGWDCYFIVQSLVMLDKQVRTAFGEHLVVCRRMDRVRIPLIGSLLKALTFGLVSGKLPHIHVALVRYGIGPGSLHTDTWVYRGHALYEAYDSAQVISGRGDGAHSLLWYATPKEIAKWPPRPKPKLHAVNLAASLPRDDAWRLARRYVASLPSRQTFDSKVLA